MLVDYENVHKVDLSVLDDSYSAIIFVGVNQNIPKAARKESTAHRFRRADFRKVGGAGKNALDFHIAFQLGRTFETSPSTICIVLSRDKGFDPLLQHLNSVGFQCRRIDSLDELVLHVERAFLRVQPTYRCAIGAEWPAQLSITAGDGVRTAADFRCLLNRSYCRQIRGPTSA